MGNTVYTEEQTAILEAVKDKSIRLLKVQAVAGAGKTFVLKEIVKQYRPNKGCYTAFNKEIVEDSRRSFPDDIVDVSTMHAIAYKYVVKPNKLKIEDFTYMCIEEDISPRAKSEVMKYMDDFFASGSMDMKEFLKEGKPELTEIAYKYAIKMFKGEIPVTFAFTLKMLHLNLVRKQIPKLRYDLFMLDEAQDCTAVMLEIFRYIPAKLKLMVGDTSQEIYKFMGTINGFEYFKDKGVNFTLTNTFRCSEEIASRIQDFGTANISSTFKFISKQPDSTVRDGKFAYLARTNATLIQRMLTCKAGNINFSTVKPIAEIFSQAMDLMSVMSGKTVHNKKNRFLVAEKLKYDKEKGAGSTSFYMHILDKYKHDIALVGTIKLVMTVSFEVIMSLYIHCKKMKKNKSIILATAHAVKGVEYDTVFIEDDLNTVMDRIFTGKTKLTEQEQHTEALLAYVACSRAKFKLENCNFL